MDKLAHIVTLLSQMVNGFGLPPFRNVLIDIPETRCILDVMNIFNHTEMELQTRCSAELGSQYRAWHYEVQQEKWECFSDIRDHYVTAESTGDGKVLFHILQGKAVVYVHVEYRIGWVYVRFVGTNEEFSDFLRNEMEAA